jgi:hypothetical protein
MQKIIFIAALLLVGCNNYISIERSEHFIKNAKNIQKIICIDPQVRYFDDEEDFVIDKSESLTKIFIASVDNYASMTNLSIEIHNMEKSAVNKEYMQLVSLKKEILQSNNYQNTPLNFNQTPAYNEIEKKIFVYPPLISHEYGDFSKKFNTPFFSYIGLYYKNDKTYFYHLIVDTDRAESVYRELKMVNKKPNKNIINQLVYDSFVMFKKELNEK